jgi:hypothetical protein
MKRSSCLSRFVEPYRGDDKLMVDERYGDT